MGVFSHFCITGYFGGIKLPSLLVGMVVSTVASHKKVPGLNPGWSCFGGVCNVIPGPACPKVIYVTG